MEKRKHVRITALCNNNCRFCLAGKKRNKAFCYFVNDINKDLIQGLNDGCKRLILSGGDPTVNKNIMDIAARFSSTSRTSSRHTRAWRAALPRSRASTCR